MSDSVIVTPEVQILVLYKKSILDVALVTCPVTVDEEESIPVIEIDIVG